MNRRKFFGTLIGGVAAGAAVRTWPFRVFSFPGAVAIGRIDEMDIEHWGLLSDSMALDSTVEKELARTYYTYGIAYWNGRPQPNWDNLDRFSTDLMHVGNHRSLVCTKVDQKRKEITFSCTKSA